MVHADFPKGGADDRVHRAAARGRAGRRRAPRAIAREAVWHQKTPMGTFAIVLLEGDDLAASFGKIASSDDPIAVRFRDFVKDVHGVDLAKDPPPEVELLLDARFP